MKRKLNSKCENTTAIREKK